MLNHADSETRHIKNRDGIVLSLNHSSQPKRVRLVLNADILEVQHEHVFFSKQGTIRSRTSVADTLISPATAPVSVTSAVSEHVEEFDESTVPLERSVRLTRDEDCGLGISIKGGREHNIPILISRIFQGQAAQRSGQIYIGDAITHVNDTCIEDMTHDQVVRLLQQSKPDITLNVRFFKPASLLLRKASAGQEIDSQTTKSPAQLDGYATQTVTTSTSSEASSRTTTTTTTSTTTVTSATTVDSKTRPSVVSRASISVNTDKRWTTVLTIPLMYANMSSYVPGSDVLRTNAFEVFSLDGHSTGAIFCNDQKQFRAWRKAIEININILRSHIMVCANKNLSKDNQIHFLGWFSRYLPNFTASQLHRRHSAHTKQNNTQHNNTSASRVDNNSTPAKSRTATPLLNNLSPVKTSQSANSSPARSRKTPSQVNSPNKSRKCQSQFNSPAKSLKSTTTPVENSPCRNNSSQSVTNTSSTHQSEDKTDLRRWRPVFFALKGDCVLLFDVPPVHTQDWERYNEKVPILKSAIRILQPENLIDKRELVFLLQLEYNTFHISAETPSQLRTLENVWAKVNYLTVTTVHNVSFNCKYIDFTNVILTIDFFYGFSLLSADSKDCIWQYRFSQLKSSKDDGVKFITLCFVNQWTAKLDVQIIETSELPLVLMTMHSFFSAKLASVDPLFFDR